jgi:molecular chaperone DnaK (HSP70)
VQEAARARERLVTGEATAINVPAKAALLFRDTRFDRADLARIGEEHGIPDAIRHTIDRARADAGLAGTDRKPGAVLLTGEYCTLPWVAEIISMHCPGITVRCNHPLDAVARGAALYEPVAAARNRIVNDYVLRYRDPVTGEHQYRFLARRGTRFPSAGQVARVVISATYDGQCQLGLPLCEIPSAGDEQPAGDFELVAGSDGGLHIVPPSPDTEAGSRPVPVITENPVFLSAIPPAKKGEPRFELTFRLDRESRLCVTARDLVSGNLVKENEPVHRLR